MRTSNWQRRSSNLRSTSTSRFQRSAIGMAVGLFIALLLTLLWALNLFASQQLWTMDWYYVPEETTGITTIVAIDDESLSRFGRSPLQWSREIYADLVEKISNAGARVIAFDMLFVEPDSGDTLFAETMQAARNSENRTRFVMAATGNQLSDLIESEDNTIQIPTFNSALLPNPVLMEQADQIGYVNAVLDPDGVLRRQLSLLQDADRNLAFSFSLATYLNFLRIPNSAVTEFLQMEDSRLYYAPERSIPTDDHGIWHQNFFGTPASAGNTTFPIVPLYQVLEDDFDPAIFEDKIVLVGLLSTGAIDQFSAPLSANGEFMSGTEIQANAIETLHQNAAITIQPGWSQILMIFVLSIVSSLVYANLRWFYALLASLGFIISLIILSFLYFQLTLQMINLFYPILAITLPILPIIGLNTTLEINRRRKSEFLLSSVVAVSEQQLVVDKILEHVAQDVMSIFPESTGTIWLNEGNPTKPRPAYIWGTGGTTQANGVSQIIQQAQATKTTVKQKDQIITPIKWQDHILGYIQANTNYSAEIPKSEEFLLEDLASQIAPSIENATLHHQLEQQRDMLATVLSGSPTGIVVLDENKKIVQANDIFLQALNLTEEKIAATSIIEIAEELGADKEKLASMEEQLELCKPFREELFVPPKNFHVAVAPLTMSRMWIVTFNDVTELVQLNLFKTHMIRMASHDLKNPLSRILGYSNMLLLDKEELSDKQENFVRNIVRSGEEINNIIGEILNLERLRAAKMDIRPFNLSAVVRTVIVQEQFTVSLKKHQFIMEFPDTPIIVDGDESQIKQVISNLINNAMKYTPDGGTITLRLYERDQLVYFEVADTGFGIPQKAQDKLFTAFYRVRTRQTAEISGTGLGLSLVKSVVEAHHGHVWFESEEGVGSTFGFSLPA